MPDSFSNVLILCMRHTHKTRTTKVRNTLPNLIDATEKLQSCIDQRMDKKGLILEASLLCGMAQSKFINKFEKWLKMWNEGRWCVKCKQQPVRDNNRYFCTICYGQTSGKVQLAVGSGRCVNHTGGKGRER